MPLTSTQSATQEYRMAKGWRIFIYAAAPLLTLLFLYLALLPLLDDTIDPSAIYFFGPLGVGMAAFMVYGLADAIKSRLYTQEDRIIQVGVFKTQELLVSQVKGYTSDPFYLRIQPVNKQLPTLKVSIHYLSGREELTAWLDQKVRDLDTLTYIEEETQLLRNDRLGSTLEEKEAKLTHIRKVVKGLNGAGLAVGLWLIFFPAPYSYAVLAGVAVPLVLLGACYYYRGFLRLNDKQKGAYPSLTSGILLPSLGLMVRAISDFELLEYAPIWPWAGAIGGLLFGGLLFSTKEFTYQKAQEYFLLLFILLFCLPYGYGVAVMANCLLDTSAPAVYTAEVQEKRISESRRSTSYYLKLSPWGPRPQAEEVSVSSDQYEATEEGQLISVQVYPGTLQVPWLTIAP